MSLKLLFGLFSIALALIGYIPYIQDILAHKTKPHAFSWLVWAILSAIAFGIQLTKHGGPGAWLMGFTACITFFIFLLASKYGEKNIVLLDWACLSLSLIALGLWVLVDKPLESVLLIAFVDAVGGFVPTFRKAFPKPYEETLILYYLYAVSLGCSLLALQSFTLITAFYPASFVAINLLMATFLSIRRRQLRSV